MSISLLAACQVMPTKQSERVDNVIDVSQHWLTAVSQPEQRLTDQLLLLLDDKQAMALVGEALTANYDLKQSAIRIKQQQQSLLISGASRQPELDFSFDKQRAKQVEVTDSHSAGFNLSWEVDIWGRLADSVDAAQGELDAVQLDYQAAKNSLAGRVIQRWIEISVRQQVIDAEQQRINSLQNTQAVITERYQAGLGNLVDLEAARSATARTQASLVARMEQQQEAKRQLNLLLSRSPSHPTPEINQVIQLKQAAVSLPVQVIAARPDLQAAYRRILVADANTSVAYKALLPSFNLTANLTNSGETISDLLSASSAWSLLGRLTAPLFNGGRLQAQVDTAALTAENAYLDYQKTLLTAIKEVEDALGQETALAQQELHLTEAKDHSDASLEHYLAAYSDGLADILDLLNAEQTAFDAHIQLLEVQQSRLANRVDLGLALGMGV